MHPIKAFQRWLNVEWWLPPSPPKPPEVPPPPPKKDQRCVTHKGDTRKLGKRSVCVRPSKVLP